MFKRTNSGISSEHLFYDVDFIVYCEGAISDNSDHATLDALFWQSAFEAFSDKRIYCKTSGSKADLAGVANKVVSDEISNVIVVMDRDYDDLFYENFHHKKIIYTYGYSWESDAAALYRFSDVFRIFAPVPNCRRYEADYNAFCSKLKGRLKRCCALDIRYFKASEALFDRNKPQSIINTEKEHEPDIDVGKLLGAAKFIEKYSLPPIDRVLIKNIDGFSRFFGKSVSKLIYHWFVFRTSSIKNRQKMAYAAFMAAVIVSIQWANGAVSPVRSYFETVILASVG